MVIKVGGTYGYKSWGKNGVRTPFGVSNDDLGSSSETNVKTKRDNEEANVFSIFAVPAGFV